MRFRASTRSRCRRGAPRLPRHAHRPAQPDVDRHRVGLQSVGERLDGARLGARRTGGRRGGEVGERRFAHVDRGRRRVAERHDVDDRQQRAVVRQVDAGADRRPAGRHRHERSDRRGVGVIRREERGDDHGNGDVDRPESVRRHLLAIAAARRVGDQRARRRDERRGRTES